MRRMIRAASAASLFALAIVGSGCATSFTGDAHFPGGARGCYAQCQAEGMVMASFVYMGEYSTGCVCAPASAPAAAAGSGAVAGAAAVGVVLQARNQEEQQNLVVQ